MTDREFHPAADTFPLIQGQEFDALVEDIRTNGLNDPIILDKQGRILDGRNRYRACLKAGVEPRFEDWQGKEGEEMTFVVSANLQRRHLTTGQKAMWAAEHLVPGLVLQGKKRRGEASRRRNSGEPKRGNRPDLDAPTVAGKMVGVGENVMDKCSHLLREAPDLADEVRAGGKTAGGAYAELLRRTKAAGIEIPEGTQAEQIIELHRQGYSKPIIAAALKTDVSVVERTIAGARVAEANSPDPQSLMDAERRAERYRLEAEEIRAKYKTVVKHEAQRDIIAEGITKSLTRLPEIPVLRRTPSEGKSEGRHTAVALLSDLHAGEVVDIAAMRGLGGYDWEIFRQRLGLWVERVLFLVELRRTRLQVDDLAVFMDGDMLSGDIHEELVATNAMSIADAMAMTSQCISHALMQLAQHFDSILVSCTVGNHTRMSKQPSYKQRVKMNWDTLVYQTCAGMTAKQPNITWDIPPSWFQITDVLNTSILHFHGDGIVSWAGFPWYGLDRATKKLREALGFLNETYNAVCVGHFHVPLQMETPGGPIIVNGSFPGGNEFALGKLYTFLPPYQTLLTVHEERGIVSRELIDLSRQEPKHAEGMPGALSEVWSDVEL